MEQLHSYLSQNGITQRSFAATVGVDESVVSKWLSGSASPGWQRAVFVSQVTGGAVPVEAWVKYQSQSPSASAPLVGAK